MMNSPWAMLMTFIRPNVSARPSAISSSTAPMLRPVNSRLLAPLAAGSHLVVSHAGAEGRLDWERVGPLYQQAAASVTARSRTQVEQLFTGVALVDPGVVWLPQWRPDPEPGLVPVGDARWSGGLAGVGRKL